MTSDDEAQSDPTSLPEGGESGLFSQLPRTRPGMRSPRRRDNSAGSGQRAAGRQADAPTPAALRAERAAEEVREAAGFDPLDPAGAEREPTTGDEAPPRPRREEPDSEPEENRSLSPAGLEDLAWAGVAVTAEAATLGVRLLGRAVDAAKRATERS